MLRVTGSEKRQTHEQAEKGKPFYSITLQENVTIILFDKWRTTM